MRCAQGGAKSAILGYLVVQLTSSVGRGRGHQPLPEAFQAAAGSDRTSRVSVRRAESAAVDARRLSGVESLQVLLQTGPCRRPAPRSLQFPHRQG